MSKQFVKIKNVFASANGNNKIKNLPVWSDNLYIFYDRQSRREFQCKRIKKNSGHETRRRAKANDTFSQGRFYFTTGQAY